MKVILKKDVAKLGDANEVVTVKNGYGRNYLIPQGYAKLATPSAIKVNAENKKQRAHKEEKIKATALAIAANLENKQITIGAKTSTTGKIFGSVNSIQLAEAINKKGFEIDRKQITFKEDSVKEVGKYTAIVKLHKEVKVEVAFEVVSE